jgi:hypothetical protein
MVKKLNILIGIILLSGIFNGKLTGQINVSATGHVFAEVISVFIATETSQLNFGRFSPGPQGGQIILSPQGAVSTLGSVVLSGGMHNAASFVITGDDNAMYSITLPNDPIILNNTTNAKTMVVSDWHSDPASGSGVGIMEGGSQSISIGATLEVSTLDNNPTGFYTGIYVVTFGFN